MVVLHSMLLALQPDKFANNLCKKPSDRMDELHEEMSRFKNEVRQAE